MKQLLLISLCALLFGCGGRALTRQQMEIADFETLVRARSQLDTSYSPTSFADWGDEDAYRAGFAARAAKGLGWTEDDQRRVADAKIWKGMTRDQLWWSWGPPARIHKDSTPAGVTERWHYGSLLQYDHMQWVTLQNDRVVWWHLGDSTP